MKHTIEHTKRLELDVLIRSGLKKTVVWVREIGSHAMQTLITEHSGGEIKKKLSCVELHSSDCHEKSEKVDKEAGNWDKCDKYGNNVR